MKPVLTLLLLITAACTKPAPAPAAVDAHVVPAPAAEAPAPSAPQGPKPFALVVAFISPGNGTDSEAAARLDAIVNETSPRPARTTGHWGMEGEHDECFTLSELSAEQQGAFMDRIKREVVNERVQMKIGGECRDQRR